MPKPNITKQLLYYYGLGFKLLLSAGLVIKLTLSQSYEETLKHRNADLQKY